MRKFIDIVETITETTRPKFGFDIDTVWYHGSPKDFEDFDLSHVGKGTDANGSGFYFTSDPTEVVYYGKVKSVYLRLDKEVSRTRPLTKNQIRYLLLHGDEDMLENFGDLSTTHKSVVVNNATQIYSDLPAYDAMITISNDFYRGNENEFLVRFVKITKCNHITAENKRHVVMFDPRDIIFANQISQLEKNVDGKMVRYNNP